MGCTVFVHVYCLHLCKVLQDVAYCLFAHQLPMCVCLSFCCHELAFAALNPSLFHLEFQRGIFGEENGDDAMEKT